MFSLFGCINSFGFCKRFEVVRSDRVCHDWAVIPEPYSIVLIGLGVCFGFCTGSKYLYEMWQGRVKPNKVTWLIFGLAPLIGASAMLTAGFSWSVVSVIMAGVWPLIIFTASLFVSQSYWETKPFDYVCGGLSVLAIVLWQMTAIPLIAVFLTITADLLAGLPTAKKAWRFPQTESPWIFASGVYSNSVAVLVLTEFTWLSASFPIYLATFSAVLVWLCVRRSLSLF